MSHLIWYPGHRLYVPDMVKAENCSLYDAAGKRYVDLEAGVWCLSLGHAHPRLLDVMSRQAAQLAHTGFCYAAGVTEAAAGDFLHLLGFDGGKCVFLCSGSESVEYGVRVAQMLLPRPLMLTMSDSYFGAYGSASRKEADAWFCFDWMPCADCPAETVCNSSCDRWASIPLGDIGGFLFEPGSSSGMVRFPPAKLIRAICREVQQSGGLVMVNEVTTGIGRTGQWFGYQHYDVAPDIVATGKGVGNGYPVSVAAFSSGVVSKLEGRTIPYAQSHLNDALGAVVVREVIRIIREDNLVERCRELSALLVDGLEAVGARTGKVAAVRARGLMMAVELRDDADAAFTTRLHGDLVKRGFFITQRPGTTVFRIDPSLTVDKADLEAFLACFEQLLH